MTLKKLPRGYKVYLPLVLTLIFFVLMLPRSPRLSYEYKKGEHWMYETLVAEFDFPILKTDVALKAEKDSVKLLKIPYFDWKLNVAETVARDLDKASAGTEDGVVSFLKDSVLNHIYSRGVFSPNDSNHYLNGAQDAVCVLLVDDFNEKKVPISEVYTIEGAHRHILSSLLSAVILKTRNDNLIQSKSIINRIDLDITSRKKRR